MKKHEDRLEMDQYLFHQGTHYNAYEFLGAHVLDDNRVRFITWAPNAHHVQLMCNYNHFSGDGLDFERLNDQGLWVLYTDKVHVGDVYKYKIHHANGYNVKSDPYAQYSEVRPNNASIVYKSDFKFTDDDWMARRRNSNIYESPINIYEIHLGSWKRHFTDDQNPNGTYFYTYQQFIDTLIPYLQEMNYTHVEFLPLGEHPFDASWGYQMTGYFSATSRYGTPDELKQLINALHRAGIGVIMDVVLAHFNKDDHGLRRFDGTPTYEHPDEYIANKRAWGTLTFDFGRNEVQSFLVSSCLFWIKEFHIDGLRVDAVHSMIDLNFENYEEHEKIYNEHGDDRNIAGIEIIKKINTAVFKEDTSILMMAEDSSDIPLITHPIDNGGLGFNFKWDLGWMHDRLKYISKSFDERMHYHDKMTFTMMYKYNENYVLPLSHDEVVHYKKSILDKQQGDQWQQFAGVRVLYGNQMSEPGKQLLFMGQEIGMYHEWKDHEEVDWHLLEFPLHQQLKLYMKDLNALYRDNPEFYQLDYEQEGFQWMVVNDRDNGVFAYTRSSRDGFKVCVLNFKPDVHFDYSIPVPLGGEYKEIFNSDHAKYGGSGVINGTHQTIDQAMNNQDQHIKITVSPLAFIVFEFKN